MDGMNSSSNQMTSTMTSWRRMGLALLGSSLLLVPLACAPDGPSTNPHNSLIVVSDTPSSDNPEQITVSSVPGAEVLVDLPFSGGTGYTWAMPEHSEGVELVGKPETKALKGNLPGGPMMATFKLKVTATGRQTARLELARPWETDTPAARTVDIVINAGEAP